MNGPRYGHSEIFCNFDFIPHNLDHCVAERTSGGLLYHNRPQCLRLVKEY